MPTGHYHHHRIPASDRFPAKVAFGPGCQIWMGARGKDGYGLFRLNGHTRAAHRVAYELYVWKIPPGMTIDHLCRTPACVNPNHLDAVSMRENILRGLNPAAINARKVCCSQGHPFDEKNTYREQDGHRKCRTCMAKAWRP